jgi:hypothetical protein
LSTKEFAIDVAAIVIAILIADWIASMWKAKSVTA